MRGVYAHEVCAIVESQHDHLSWAGQVCDQWQSAGLLCLLEQTYNR